MGTVEVSREKVDLQRTMIERIIDIAILAFTIMVVIYFIMQIPKMPATVPIHFSGGEADDWGSPWTFIGLPAIGIAVWVGLSILEKIPEKHNYLWLTETNRKQQYRNSQLFIWAMKNTILLYFAIVTLEILGLAKNEDVPSFVWSLSIFLIVIFGQMFYFIYRSYKMRDIV